LAVTELKFREKAIGAHFSVYREVSPFFRARRKRKERGISNLTRVHETFLTGRGDRTRKGWEGDGETGSPVGTEGRKPSSCVKSGEDKEDQIKLQKGEQLN